MKTLFFSLQGLGNSIINFPILNQLRSLHPVTTIAFRNGSSAFFKAFHPDVIEMDSNFGLLKETRKQKAEASFSCFPTWRREFSSAFLAPVRQRYVLRPVEKHWFSGLMRYSSEPQADVHHLENNMALLRKVSGFENFDAQAALNLRSAFGLNASANPGLRILGLHPTASNIVKFYPLSFWSELLPLLGEDFDQIRMFCGGAQIEEDFCEKIRATLPAPLAAKVEIQRNRPFAELVGLIDSVSYFIGSDSSLMHLAALLDKPLLGLWSFANYRVIYPYGRAASIYVPRETLSAKTFEYGVKAPPYFHRVSAQAVNRIFRNLQPVDFSISTALKGNVHAYVY